MLLIINIYSYLQIKRKNADYFKFLKDADRCS